MLPKKARPQGPEGNPNTKADTEPKQLALFPDEPVTQEPPSPSRSGTKRLEDAATPSDQKGYTVDKKPNVPWIASTVAKLLRTFYPPSNDNPSFMRATAINQKAKPALSTNATERIIRRTKPDKDFDDVIKSLGFSPAEVNTLITLCKNEEACIIVAKGPDPDTPSDLISKGVFIYVYDSNQQTWLEYSEIFAGAGPYDVAKIKNGQWVNEPLVFDLFKNNQKH